jgi:hypothetical protein
MTKYRFICLLSHASKVLQVCLLRRLVHETNWYLPSHQAGFRANRSTADNIYILAQIMDAVLARGESMVNVFIDYTAAFDSVSHKFIDEALAEAKASDKSRSIFRAIYREATAVVRVRKNDGTDAYSGTFPVDRGVIQGAIDSPVSPRPSQKVCHLTPWHAHHSQTKPGCPPYAPAGVTPV